MISFSGPIFLGGSYFHFWLLISFSGTTCIFGFSSYFRVQFSSPTLIFGSYFYFWVPLFSFWSYFYLFGPTYILGPTLSFRFHFYFYFFCSSVSLLQCVPLFKEGPTFMKECYIEFRDPPFITGSYFYFPTLSRVLLIKTGAYFYVRVPHM